MKQSQEQSSELSAPEDVSWLAPQEQQFWFDRFAARSADRNNRNDEPDQEQPVGLRFQQFQEFLGATLYRYFARFPSKRATKKEPAKGNGNGNLVGALGDLDLNGADSPVEGERESCCYNKQQEMLLFKRFDTNNDHVIDRDEFALLCQKWLHRVFAPTCALVIVDVQNDFIDGSLALINGPAGQDGAEVVPVVNDLIGACQHHKAAIVYTQDWHPQDHLSFHENLYLRKHKLKEDRSNNNNNNSKTRGEESESGDVTSEPPRIATPEPSEDDERKFVYKKFLTKAKVFDTVLFDEGRIEQKLWPTHCVGDSWGAQLHPGLKIAPESITIQKGTLSHVDAYSAFWDNMRSNETGLRQELVAKGVTDLFFCGLALDYCVAASALDAAKAGFITFVVEDACRGIDLGEIEKRKQELVDHGAFLVRSDMVESYLGRDLEPVTSTSGASSGHSSKTGHFSLDCSLIKTVTYRKAFPLS